MKRLNQQKLNILHPKPKNALRFTSEDFLNRYIIGLFVFIKRATFIKKNLLLEI